VQTPQGSHTFAYDPATGQLSEALSRDGQRIARTYDGSLLTQVSWSGVVTGMVSYAYDNDLRVTQMSYGGQTLTNVYDRDDLLTQIGSITVERDPGNGQLKAVRDGAFELGYARNEYGEVTTNTVSRERRCSR